MNPGNAIGNISPDPNVRISRQAQKSRTLIDIALKISRKKFSVSIMLNLRGSMPPIAPVSCEGKTQIEPGMDDLGIANARETMTGGLCPA